jgi:hypothetical protein
MNAHAGKAAIVTGASSGSASADALADGIHRLRDKSSTADRTSYPLTCDRIQCVRPVGRIAAPAKAEEKRAHDRRSRHSQTTP